MLFIINAAKACPSTSSATTMNGLFSLAIISKTGKIFQTGGGLHSFFI